MCSFSLIINMCNFSFHRRQVILIENTPECLMKLCFKRKLQQKLHTHELDCVSVPHIDIISMVPHHDEI